MDIDCIWRAVWRFVSLGLISVLVLDDVYLMVTVRVGLAREKNDRSRKKERFGSSM